MDGALRYGAAGGGRDRFVGGGVNWGDESSRREEERQRQKREYIEALKRQAEEQRNRKKSNDAPRYPTPGAIRGAAAQEVGYDVQKGDIQDSNRRYQQAVAQGRGVIAPYGEDDVFVSAAGGANAAQNRGLAEIKYASRAAGRVDPLGAGQADVVMRRGELEPGNQNRLLEAASIDALKGVVEELSWRLTTLERGVKEEETTRFKMRERIQQQDESIMELRLEQAKLRREASETISLRGALAADVRQMRDTIEVVRREGADVVTSLGLRVRSLEDKAQDMESYTERLQGGATDLAQALSEFKAEVEIKVREIQSAVSRFGGDLGQGMASAVDNLKRETEVLGEQLDQRMEQQRAEAREMIQNVNAAMDEKFDEVRTFVHDSVQEAAKRNGEFSSDQGDQLVALSERIINEEASRKHELDAVRQEVAALVANAVKAGVRMERSSREESIALVKDGLMEMVNELQQEIVKHREDVESNRAFVETVLKEELESRLSGEEGLREILEGAVERQEKAWLEIREEADTQIRNMRKDLDQQISLTKRVEESVLKVDVRFSQRIESVGETIASLEQLIEQSRQKADDVLLQVAASISGYREELKVEVQQAREEMMTLKQRAEDGAMEKIQSLIGNVSAELRAENTKNVSEVRSIVAEVVPEMKKFRSDMSLLESQIQRGKEELDDEVDRLKTWVKSNLEQGADDMREVSRRLEDRVHASLEGSADIERKLLDEMRNLKDGLRSEQKRVEGRVVACEEANEDTASRLWANFDSLSSQALRELSKMRGDVDSEKDARKKLDERLQAEREWMEARVLELRERVREESQSLRQEFGNDFSSMRKELSSIDDEMKKHVSQTRDKVRVVEEKVQEGMEVAKTESGRLEISLKNHKENIDILIKNISRDVEERLRDADEFRRVANQLRLELKESEERTSTELSNYYEDIALLMDELRELLWGELGAVRDKSFEALEDFKQRIRDVASNMYGLSTDVKAHVTTVKSIVSKHTATTEQRLGDLEMRAVEEKEKRMAEVLEQRNELKLQVNSLRKEMAHETKTLRRTVEETDNRIRSKQRELDDKSSTLSDKLKEFDKKIASTLGRFSEDHGENRTKLQALEDRIVSVHNEVQGVHETMAETLRVKLEQLRGDALKKLDEHDEDLTRNKKATDSLKERIDGVVEKTERMYSSVERTIPNTIENIREMVGTTSTKLSGVEASFNTHIKDMDHVHHELRRLDDVQRNDRSDFRHDIESMRAQLEKALRDVQKALEEAQAIKTGSAATNDKMDNALQRVVQAEAKVHNALDRLSETSSSVQSIESTLQQLNEEIEHVRTKMKDDLETSIGRLETKLGDQIEDIPKSMQGSMDETLSKVSELEKKFNRQMSTIDDRIAAVAGTRQGPEGDTEEQWEQVNKAIANLNSEFSAVKEWAENELEKLRVEISTQHLADKPAHGSSSDVDALSKVENRYEKLEERIATLEDLRSTVAGLDSKVKELVESESNVKGSPGLEVQEVEAKMKSLQKDIESLTEGLSELKQTSKYDINAMKTEIEDVREEIKNIVEEFNSLYSNEGD